jgi:solute carrier family 34 (sodium-dependent phosphate cotransporter)
LENESFSDTNANRALWNKVRTAFYIIGALVLFLFALDLMISSLQHLGHPIAETILQATFNPFTGLFIGLLITAMLQSSSTTTSLVVALVASDSLSLESAVPIIMGANVGTTITAVIVSLGFINKKKEFRRAVSAGSYHVFFNLLTVIILFPLEYYYGFLSTLSSRIAGYFLSPVGQPVENTVNHFWSGFDPVINFLLKSIPSPFVLSVLALILLFGSILIFRKIISDLLKATSPETFSRFFFKNPLKSFGWGLLTTAAIRSSTITTTVVVPIVAKKITTLRQAAPFIMGANVGTTITAFIAVTLQANTSSAISIAIAHFLFNFFGVILFFPVPVLRKLPLELANGLGRITLKYRLAGFVFLLLTFFFIPFSLIYINQGNTQTLHLTYQKHDTVQHHYRIKAKMNQRTKSGEWSYFEGEHEKVKEEPMLIYPVYSKKRSLFIGDRMFLFNRPGFCWDGENEDGKFKACVQEILSDWKIPGQSFDSVYVYRFGYLRPDSLRHTYYMSAPYHIMLQHQVEIGQDTTLVEKLTSFEEK